MSVSRTEYDKLTKKYAPNSPLLKDCCKAFLFGGAICCFGELLFTLYGKTAMQETEIRAAVPITLIVITSVLTAIGVFDKIARHAGAGTLVPITGFANAVVCSAMEYRNEGKILGVGAKIFTIAGPVILYGTAAGTVYGLIYWIITKVVT